jgi:hypothetical protein
MVCLLICWSRVMWSWSRVVFLSTSIPCINSRHTVMWFYFFLDKLLTYPLLVVHWSSETLTNLLDVIIRSDDRFLYLVVDSDSIVSKIYRLNFVLWLLLYCCFFFVSILTKILQFYPSWFFFALILTISGSFVQAYFWHSVNTHFWTSLSFIYFPE